jgi:ribosome biogenesis GTPase
MKELKHLGFEGEICDLIPLENLDENELARVVVEHKERYVVQTITGAFNAEIMGTLRFSARSREDFPAVGDWVKITMMDENSAIILEIFPRTTMLQRQAVGKLGEIQIIATNIDFGFIVQSVGHDFNLKRMERYLAICYASNIEPIILLTKIDLAEKDEAVTIISQIEDRIKDVAVIALSNETKEGLDELKSLMKPCKSYCFLGSSGVGKTTIVNHLKGEAVLKTSAISDSTSKGRHTTSHRELILLPNESIVIDTPGMRELGMTDQVEGIEMTYEDIVAFSKECKYLDCSHTNEAGCAVIEAVEQEDIPQEMYQNYLKLMREQEHFSSTASEKKKKDKDFGKMVKHVKKVRKDMKY